MLHTLKEKWHSGIHKQLDELEKEMYVSIRNPDQPISELIAQRVLDRTVPINTIDIVLGVVSEQPIDTMLELGGSVIACDKIQANEMVPTKILGKDGTYWPLPVVSYHTIKLLNIPKHANVWVLGVRVNDKTKEFLNNQLRIPDLLWIKNQCYLTNRPSDDDNYVDISSF